MQIMTLDEVIKDFGKIEKQNLAKSIWKLPTKKLVRVSIPYIKY